MSSDPLHAFLYGDDEIRQQINGFGHIITIPFYKLHSHDKDYAKRLTENPDKEIKTLSDYVSSLARRKTEVHIIDVPLKPDIHKLFREKLYTLIEIKGVVIQISEIKKRPETLVFQCPSCLTKIEVPQTEQWLLKPDNCTACDNRKGFKKLYEETDFADHQWIEIQELVDSVKQGETPETVRVLLKNWLTKTCTPGETVTITGITKVYESSPSTRNLELNFYVDAVSLINNTEERTIEVTDEDITKLNKLAQQPDHLQKTIQSFAPTVYGEEIVKEALIYQQCEGVELHLTKQKRRRGQFHILLAGPPGVAKSDLGEYQALYHVKGRAATGRGSSSVGLTASVVRENDEWVLKAGAMALADRGLLFVDEIEKMRREDSGAMHPGMEAQQIPINKAGINAVVKTRCSIIAACNPMNGVWNAYGTLHDNLIYKGGGLTTALLNRFALIFVILTKSTVEEEGEVIDHILSINEGNGIINTPYSEDTLRKLFSYARTLRPRISSEVNKKLRDFYLNMFKAQKLEQTTIMSRRQIEDLVRLSEASAKLHLRENVTTEDAENAVRVLAESLKSYGVNPSTGKIDQSSAFYGEKKTKKDMVRETPMIIQRLCKRNIDTTKVSREEFIEYASKTWRCAKHEAGEALEVCLKDGSVFCPTPYTVAAVSTLDEDTS